MAGVGSALTALTAVSTWARKYPLAPRYRREERLWLYTADGVRLAASRIEGPPDAPATIVLVHGFLNSSRSPRVYAFAREMARWAHVVVPELRGHGASAGRTTLGRLEPLDVAAAVGAAQPDLPVVTVGTSLGGVAVIRHAATHRGVAGVVSISAPAWSGAPDRPGIERVARLVGSRAGRHMSNVLLRTRIAAELQPLPSAETLMPRIAPAFTVVVHDEDDLYFGGEHAESLHRWAQEPKELWWYPGGGHGSDLLTLELSERLMHEVSARVRAPAPSGSRAPARPAGSG